MARSRVYLVTSLLFATGARADDNFWSDFANNLATDLAPLIQLFGETVTKQYLSESLTTWDNIIFACAPLGILTALVSAIRVRGNPSFKAFIGRAQESTGVAELELLSSTSKNTSELWHRGGVARMLGQPLITGFVCTRTRRGRDSDDDDDSTQTDDVGEIEIKPLDVVLREARAEILDRRTRASMRRPRFAATPSAKDRPSLSDLETPSKCQGWEYIGSSEIPPAKDDNKNRGGPNLSLNFGIKRYSPMSIYFCAAIGLLLQLGMLAFTSVTIYVRPDLFPLEIQANYGFPCVIAGTVLLCLGMFFCATIIESSTIEDYFLKNDRSSVWLLQMGGQKVGDQVFPAFAVKQNSNLYIRSTQKPQMPTDQLRLSMTVGITVVGFILQFVGLRAVHPIVTIVQLGCTLVMSFIRALLRSSRPETHMDILPSVDDEFHELDQLAHRLINSDEEPEVSPRSRSDATKTRTNPSGFSGPKDREASKPPSILSLVRLRARLGDQFAAKYSKASQPPSAEVAKNLQQALEDCTHIMMTQVNPELALDPNMFKFGLKIYPDRGRLEEYRLILRRDTGIWRLESPSELEAIIGLWSWTIGQGPGNDYRVVVDDSTLEKQFDKRAYHAWIQRRFEPVALSQQTDGDADDYWDWYRGLPDRLFANLEDDDSSILQVYESSIHIKTGATYPQIQLYVPGVFAGFPRKLGSEKALWIPLKQRRSLTCGQDLYMRFLEHFFTHLRGGYHATWTLREPSAKVKPGDVLTLKHSLVERLADSFEASSLGSREDAYMLIIPSMVRTSHIPPLQHAYRVVLSQAIHRGDKETIQTIIRAQAVDESIALEAAVSSSSPEIIQTILNTRDADAPLPRDGHDWTAAHLAWALQDNKTIGKFTDVQISEQPCGFAPDRWRADQDNSHTVDIDHESGVVTSVHKLGDAQDPSPVLLRADHPIPVGKYVYWFEVEILEMAESDKVSIGVSGRDMFKYNPLLGRDEWTWAFLSNGKKLHGDGHDFGPPFKKGDKIRCEVDFRGDDKRASLSFQKNDEPADVAFRKVKGRLWPSVGFKCKSPVKIKATFQKLPAPEAR